jgi:hypothetical protein
VKCTINWPDGTTSTQTQTTQNYTFCKQVGGTLDENGNVDFYCEVWKYCPEIGSQSKILVGIYGDDPGEEEEEEDCKNLPVCDIPFTGHTIERIEIEKKPSFQVYPNPLTDYLNIVYAGLEGETFLTISIFDFVGRMVYSQKNAVSDLSGIIRLDTKNQLPSGPYRMVVSGEVKGMLHQDILIHLD